MPILLQTTRIKKSEVSHQLWELGRRLSYRLLPLMIDAILDGTYAIRVQELIRRAGLSRKRRSVALEALGVALAWLWAEDLLPDNFVVIE
jgi:hypothetical protein